MQPIAANHLLAGVGLADGSPVTAVVTDSRKVVPGCVFVCFPGQKVDGHDYAAAAIRDGAAWVVANHPVPGVPAQRLILCANSHHAMVRMAANYRTLFSPTLIGVTGSVGKTTTKEFCYAVLSAFGPALKTEGNQNNEIGLPNTLFRLDDTIRYGVVEMGMSNLGEIERLTRAARPSAGIITCIGVSHLESLGSRENILKAKMEICAGLPDGAPLVLNRDDDLLPGAQVPGRLHPVWFSAAGDISADVRALDVRDEDGGQAFTIEDRRFGRFEARIPVLGRHNVADALAAWTAATRLGLDPARAAAALADYQATGMRQHIVQCGGVTVVEDCYNASPDSMKASLTMFGQMPLARRAALLGDMLELGAVSEEAHTQTGRWAAENGVNYLVAYGPQSALTARAAAEAGVEAVHCTDPEEAAARLAAWLRPGDGLLAKASRGMALETILQRVYQMQKKGE